ALTSFENQAFADFDQCDGSGILTNYIATTSGYYIQIWDSQASSGTPNRAKLFRRSGGTSAQIGSTAIIPFTRGHIRRFMIDVQAVSSYGAGAYGSGPYGGATIVVSMDGNQI